VRRILPILTLVLMSALMAGPVCAAETPDPGLAALLAASGEQHIPASAAAEGPAAMLAAATGIETFPTACATPILIGAWRENAPSETLRQVMVALAAAPLPAEARSFTTRDGRFTLRYLAAGASARDGDVAPEMVARAAEALVAARAYLSATLNYPDPAPAGERIAVYLTRLGHGLEGYVVPPRGGARPAPAFVVLDAGLSADRLMPAVLHQTAHLSLLRSAESETWWSEATASFLTLMGTGDLGAQQEALRARLQSTARGLAADGLLQMQGSLLWPLFLAERSGDPDIVRRIWSAMADGGIDAVAAADSVLAHDAQMRPGAAFREMAIWSLFTGASDDGAHFAAGRAMPDAALLAIGPALPVRVDPIDPVEPLGSIALRLPAERTRGSLALDITAHGGRPAADLLVFYHGDSARPVLVPVDLSSGTGRVSLPWGQAREAWIVLRNEARPSEAGACAFGVAAALDPFAPYDLASFTAETMGRSVVLTWTTAAEKGLVGWNVLRAEAPGGPFARVNGVAIPAYGDGEGDTGYVFVDDGARPGRRYYYLVEGITAAGLIERSHVTSARTLP
jgi:hypothetical protein